MPANRIWQFRRESQLQSRPDDLLAARQGRRGGPGGHKLRGNAEGLRCPSAPARSVGATSSDDVAHHLRYARTLTGSRRFRAHLELLGSVLLLGAILLTVLTELPLVWLASALEALR